jgi:hypothetical protein
MLSIPRKKVFFEKRPKKLLRDEAYQFEAGAWVVEVG